MKLSFREILQMQECYDEHAMQAATGLPGHVIQAVLMGFECSPELERRVSAAWEALREKEKEEKMFNPTEHLIQLKSRAGSKDYLPVQWRLVWFRDACPHGTIETEMLHLDLDRETEEEAFVWNNETRRSEKVIKQARGFVIFKATVRDGAGGIATGTKSEKAASFPDFIEKAETGAIGRALAALGFGTQFADEEFSEGERLADAPVAFPSPARSEARPAPVPAPRPTAAKTDQPVQNQNQQAPLPLQPTKQQQDTIARLCRDLGLDTPRPSTEAEAREVIAALVQQWRSGKGKRKEEAHA